MKSTFRTLFYLKKNQPKSNGLVPIIVRVTVNTQVVQFGCKLDINPEIWDIKAGKAIGRSKEASEIIRIRPIVPPPFTTRIPRSPN